MTAFDTITQFARMLANLEKWLQTATTHAQAKSFDSNVLADARLAPDQFALTQQVQAACDAAKYAAAYLSGQKAPSHPDTEKTLSELSARIQKCVEYLATFKATDFEGAEERRVAPPWMEGSSVSGKGYLMRISIPNFYFHTTVAYQILRHNGVALGKRDFIGVDSWKDIDA